MNALKKLMENMHYEKTDTMALVLAALTKTWPSVSTTETMAITIINKEHHAMKYDAIHTKYNQKKIAGDE